MLVNSFYGTQYITVSGISGGGGVLSSNIESYTKQNQ